jgi:hypothetical protein
LLADETAKNNKNDEVKEEDNVARIGEKKNAYRFLVGKRQLETPSVVWRMIL